MKTGTADEFDPQSLIPGRVQNRWKVVNRDESAVDWGHAALLVGFWVAMTATPADGERGQFLWTIPIIIILAVTFSWMGKRQRRKDAVELEKAIRVGTEIDELAKIWEEGSNSPDPLPSHPVDE